VNKTFCLALFLFFLSLTPALLACGKKEKKADTGQDNVIWVTGVVRLVGSDPFYEMVITESDKDWFIDDAEDRQKLWTLQYRTVTVEGIESVVSELFASGIPAGERYSLKNIKIIKIE